MITVGAVRGDTEAAFSDDLTTCVPANAAGERILSDAQTRLAGLSLVNLPLIGRVANVTTSQTRTRTFLDDDGTGASDVVSRTSTTIGDISLLGEAVGIKVTDPVVLEARSDGTTGTASYVNPPSVSVTAAGTTVNVLPGQTREINLGALGALADLTVTVRGAQNESTGATGAASTDAFLSVSLDVLSVPLVLQAASVDLDLAPMSVEATAPEGGVECPAIDDEAPAAPVIESPADGDVTNDPTPEFIGLAEPGTTVVVTDGEGNEICTDVADIDGAWSCTPTDPIADGEDTYTATATDEGGNTSPEATVTFEVDTVTTVELDNPADGSTTNDPSPPVSGTGEPSATITVTEGGTEVCTTTVTPGGTLVLHPDGAAGSGCPHVHRHRDGRGRQHRHCDHDVHHRSRR